jgi:hypothetical protein
VRLAPSPTLPGMNDHTITLAALAVVAALTPVGALAQPTRDAATPATAHTSAARQHHHRATYASITFTNPLGRSRGPGAGAGLL